MIATLIALLTLPVLLSAFFPKDVQAVPHTVSENNLSVPYTYTDLGTPTDLIVLPDGNIWYLDELGYRLIKISQSGEILRTVGRLGDGEGEFNNIIHGLARDGDGYLYVQSGSKTHKFDEYGGYLASWDLGYSNSNFIRYDSSSDTLLIGDSDNFRIVRSSLTGDLLDSFGSNGNGDGQFLDIQGIATDGSGNIYVVDSEPNCRVEVFDSAGNYLRQFGSCGDGDGQLTVPRGIVVTGDGNIAVASTHGHEIQEFTPQGVFVRSWGDIGDNPGQIQAPFGITIDSSGNFFVTDNTHFSIEKFDSDGIYLDSIRNSGFVADTFTDPSSVAYDSAGNMYVLDNGSYFGRIQKFTNSGTYISTIITEPALDTEAYYFVIRSDHIYVADHIGYKEFDLDGNLIRAVGSEGSENGQFIGGRGIAVDSFGNVFVSDMDNERIQKFDSDGNFVTAWGTLGSGDGQFGRPSGGLAIDENDNIYVSDNTADGGPDNSRVQVFNNNGVFIRTFGSYGTGQGQFALITGMVVDSNGELQVVSNYHDPRDVKIQVFSLDGSFLYSYGKGGSDVNQYYEPKGISINPLSSSVAIADTRNHRIQINPEGTRIFNLITSADVVSSEGEGSLVTQYFDPASEGIDTLSARLYFGDFPASDFQVNLSQDRDWNSVNVIEIPSQSKTLVVNLDPVNAPGISNTHSLFLKKYPGQDTVHVCPNAVSIDDLTAECSEGYDLTLADPSLTAVTIDSNDYWRVDGLTGTGAFSEIPPAPTPTPTPEPTSTPQPTPTQAAPGPTSTPAPTGAPSSQNTSQSPASSSNSSSGSSSNSSSGVCQDAVPVSAPDLFQINTSKNTAKLFFTPVRDTTGYYVSYSTTPGAMDYGSGVVHLAPEGIQNFTVKSLKPNTIYYYKVRGQNGCMPGPWSNIIKVKTNNRVYYKSLLTKIVSVVKPKNSSLLSPLVLPDDKPSVNTALTVTPPPATSLPVVNFQEPAPAKPNIIQKILKFFGFGSK